MVILLGKSCKDGEKAVTRLGLKILKFTKNYVRKNELPPTFVEIMAAVETKSRCAVQYAVDRLEEDQLIKRIPGRSRNIWPV
tara:strand:- start:93 stop:338 length:246 start_codon:yes stop_codon:yes gene_type:complete